MDKKGQLNMGLVLMSFIGIIVGLILFQAAVQSAGETKVQGTLTAPLGLYTAPAVGGWIDLVGQELLSVPVVYNRTGGEIVSVKNYTIEEGVSTATGLKTIRYQSNAGSTYASKTINITYTYGAPGYIDDTGAASIVSLIAIFAALAVAIVALVPTLRSGVLEMVSR